MTAWQKLPCGVFCILVSEPVDAVFSLLKPRVLTVVVVVVVVVIVIVVVVRYIQLIAHHLRGCLLVSN